MWKRNISEASHYKQAISGMNPVLTSDKEQHPTVNGKIMSNTSS